MLLRQNRNINQQRGVNLFELLIVLFMLSFLITLVSFGLARYLSSCDGRDVVSAQLTNLETALDTYFLEMKSYPQTLDELLENKANNPNWHGPYIKPSQLKDPWGTPFQYDYLGHQNRHYELFSYGADGKPGGKGHNADRMN